MAQDILAVVEHTALGTLAVVEHTALGTHAEVVVGHQVVEGGEARLRSGIGVWSWWSTLSRLGLGGEVGSVHVATPG